MLGLTATIGIGKSHTDIEARDYIIRVMACLDVTRLSQVERNKEHYLEKTVEPMEGKFYTNCLNGLLYLYWVRFCVTCVAWWALRDYFFFYPASVCPSVRPSVRHTFSSHFFVTLFSSHFFFKFSNIFISTHGIGLKLCFSVNYKKI